MPAKVFHLGLDSSQLQNIAFAFLPGDPGRVPKIAGYLEHVQELACQREFRSMRGRLHGREVLVCSTGIGGPSTAICVEELAMLGVQRFIRIGTTGALQEAINPGDIIIPTAAVRLDGASRHLAPIEFPAVGDFRGDNQDEALQPAEERKEKECLKAKQLFVLAAGYQAMIAAAGLLAIGFANLAEIIRFKRLGEKEKVA